MKWFIVATVVLLALLAVALTGLSTVPLVLLVVALIFNPSTIDAEEAHLSRHSKGIFGPGGERYGMGGWRRF